jgi:MFS family permease
MLAIAMGVGRFAYTPLLPLMESGAGLTNAMAGFIASSNLAGYLLGALAASNAAFHSKRAQTVRFAIATVVVTTGLIAVVPSSWWLAVRFVTGVGSGLAFVLGSSLVLDWIANERRPDWVAVFYSGVGLGIILTAVAVPVFGSYGGWQAGWTGLAAISAALSILTLPWLSNPKSNVTQTRVDTEKQLDPRLFGWLLAGYGAQGMGYIIPATFIVAMVAATASIAAYASASWIVVGVVAIPSTIAWNRMGLVLGRDIALAIAVLVMGIGALAPILAPNAFGVAIGAATLGGTFIGVTALANALGRQLYPQRSHIAIGRLTVVFGIGQILGPAIAGVLVSGYGSYSPALVLAAGVLCMSAALVFTGAVIARRGSVTASTNGGTAK